MILALNLDRRHLDAGQRAVFALRYERYYAEVAKDEESVRKSGVPVSKATTPGPEESRLERESAARAAKAAGASRTGVHVAKAIERDAPDLLPKVAAGTLSLNAAEAEGRELGRGRRSRARSRTRVGGLRPHVEAVFDLTASTAFGSPGHDEAPPAGRGQRGFTVV